MFKSNPNYKHQGDFNGVSVYTLLDETQYHTSRYVEALNWQTFANCGTSKDQLKAITDEMLRICNEEKNQKTIKTDIGALANVIQHGLRYPVDEHCAINVGAVLSFIEYSDKDGNVISENPDKVEPFWTAKKVQLALNNPDAYTFFFGWGVANIPEYKTHLNTLTASDYLIKRKQTIAMMLPETLKHLTS